MLYEHNSSIEPTSSTLLLQRTPSESGSYTTDEYSYRRNNAGGSKQLKNQTIERNKKNSKKTAYNNNGGTLCSKSSTTSSHISEHSKVSANKSNMFLLNEMSGQELAREPANSQENNSPPSPAPHFTSQNSSQRIFTTTISQPAAYNAYEANAFDSNGLYGGINRVQLGTRQHHTLNTRQLNGQQQPRKNATAAANRPVHNRVLDFIELNSEISGSNSPHMNLISNPLQGSLPSLVNNGQESRKVSANGGKPANRAAQQLNANSQLNRSSSSLVSESDNFYCDIEEAQRVQSDFRAKLNASQMNNNKRLQNQHQTRYLSNDSGDENADDLVSEHDRLIGGAMNRDENKLIVRNRRMPEDEDDEELLTDQYSDYEYIDRLQTTANRPPPPPASGYLRYGNKPTMFNHYGQRLTPVNLSTGSNPSASSLNEAKPRQLNLSLARNHQLSSASQPGLFRYKDAGSFSTMQPNNNRM